MPVVSITLLPGYSPQARERLVERTARTVRSVIAASNAGTTVFVNEAATYQRDGKRFTTGGPELPEASAMVRHFLERMQARDLDAARQWLAPGFVEDKAADQIGMQVDGDDDLRASLAVFDEEGLCV